MAHEGVIYHHMNPELMVAYMHKCSMLLYEAVPAGMQRQCLQGCRVSPCRYVEWLLHNAHVQLALL